MKYLPIQVKTGFEANIAEFIRQRLERLYNSNPEEYAYLCLIQVLHFTPRIEQVDREKVQRRSRSLLPGYIYVAFSGGTTLTDSLYYMLKVPGVLRVFKSYSTQEEIDVLMQQNECEVHLVVAETVENVELITKVKSIAIKFLAYLSESTEEVAAKKVLSKTVRHGRRTKQLLQLPLRVFRAICAAVGFSSEHMFSLPDLDDPAQIVRKEKVVHSLDIGWLLLSICCLEA